MQLSTQDIGTFTQLEESLWIAETRYDIAYMDDILHPDFFEFGCSGRRYTRAEIMPTKTDKHKHIDVKLPFKSFSITPLTDTVIQITYISEVQYDTLQICNRSSIWMKTNSHWQLYFHQGTAIKTEQ